MSETPTDVPALTEQQAGLINLLRERTDDGSLRYSWRQRQDFIALLLLSAGEDISLLPPYFKAVLIGFAQRIHWHGPHSGPLKPLLDAYFITNPLPDRLIRRYKEMIGLKVAPEDRGYRFQHGISG